MAVASFEGVVEDGQVRLKDSVRLPDKAKVYVLIPDYELEEVIELPPLPRVIHLRTPRFVYAAGAKRLGKVEMIEDTDDAGV